MTTDRLRTQREMDAERAGELPDVMRPGSPTGGQSPATPAVVQVRLIGPVAAVAAASSAHAEKYGPLWQPGTTKASRHGGGDVLMYGTLIVPV